MPGKDSSHLLGMTTMLESCHFERSEKSFSSVFSKETRRSTKLKERKIIF
jgi:hypothetical protein